MELSYQRGLSCKPFKKNLAKSAPSLLCLILGTVILSGYGKVTIAEYEPTTIALNDDIRLHISTYPSNFPNRPVHIPYLYEELETPKSVYFQLHVQHINKKSGIERPVKDFQIKSFSYRWPDPEQEPVLLIEDFNGSFWMQGNTSGGLPLTSPVFHDDSWHLFVRAEVILEQKSYVVEKRINARSRIKRYALLINALR